MLDTVRQLGSRNFPMLSIYVPPGAWGVCCMPGMVCHLGRGGLVPRQMICVVGTWGACSTPDIVRVKLSALQPATRGVPWAVQAAVVRLVSLCG